MNASTPAFSFHAEPLTEALYAELYPFLEREWEEVGVLKDKLVLKVDPVVITALAKAGRLSIFTLRNHGNLVGYVVFTLSKHPKYSDTSWAFMFVWFLDPSVRGHYGIALRFMSFALKELKRAGVQFVNGAHRLGHAAAGRVMEAAGFEAYEIGYLKEL